MKSHPKRANAARPAAGPGPDAVTPQTPPAAVPAAPPGPPPGRRIESWPLARLKEHEQQAALFHDLDGAAFDDLVASIAREGLREPIQVTPDGVIVDGHQRRRAAERLGWAEVTVWIREDLAGDRAAIDRAHIRANLDRRQLDPLDRVRLARRLAELELGRAPGRLGVGELKKLCGRVAEEMGLSSRHAQRLLSISGLPMPIQKAYSDGRLKVVDADRASRLSTGTQRRIAGQIEAGGDPAEIVASCLPKTARKVRPDDAYERLVTELVRGLDALEGREGEIRRPASLIPADLEAFERFGRFCEVVAPMLARRREESDRAFAELMAEYGDGATTDELDAAIA